MSEFRDAALHQLETAIYLVRTSGDPLEGQVEFVSAGTIRLLGYAPESFVRDSGLWHRIMHPDDVPVVVGQTEEVFRLHEPRTRQYRLRHAATGEYRWIEDSTVPVRSDEGALLGIAGVVRDVSDMRHKEHLLNKRALELQVLLDAMPDGVIVADDSGRIVHANSGVERILGWSHDEIVGRNVEVLLPEHLRARHALLRTDYVAAPRIRRMGTYELSALRKDGSETPVDIMLGPFQGDGAKHILVIIRDVSEVRQAQLESAYLSAIARSADDSIIGTDPSGLIVSWNRGAVTLFGYSAEEVVGNHIMMLYPPDRHAECLENLRKSGSREQQSRYDSRRIKKSGFEFDASVIVSPIEDNHGKILGMSCICRDITDRKQAEASLRMAKEAVELASHAKSEFLANMSHELRTPLNGIIGLTDVLRDAALSEEEREECLSLIETSGRELLKSLSDILDISELQSGKYLLRKGPFQIHDLVSSVVTEFESMALSKKLALSSSVSPAVPDLVIGDAECLRQILFNLLENAVKFTESGGIAVTVETAPQDPEALTFAVHDTGIGVPKARQRAIFEPFSQVDNSLRRRFGGSGLGLALCAELVDIMSGRIWVDSDVGTGSTFYFTVRLASASVSEADAAKPSAEETQKDRRRETRHLAHDPGLMRILRPFSAAVWGIQVLDTSKFGFRVRSNSYVDPGSLVQIDLKTGLFVGEVRYCRAGGEWFHAGVELLMQKSASAAR